MRSRAAPASAYADGLSVLLLLIVCLSIGLPRYRVGIDFADEGCLAYGAERVLDGQVPNRDFVSYQPPLSFYTAALIFKCFGASLASLRLLGLLLYVAIPLLLYAVSRTMLAPVSSLAAAAPAAVLGLPFFNFVPFAVWQGITASLVSVFLLMRALDGSGRSFLAAPAGVLTAASLLLRHDQALYTALAVLGYLFALRYAGDAPCSAAQRKRVLVLWLTGIAALLVPFGSYCLLKGAAPEMFRQLVIFPLTSYARTSSLPYPAFSSHASFRHNAVVALFYLPPLVGTIVALRLLRRIARRSFQLREANLCFLLTWAVLFYFQVLTRSDLQHLLITLAPFSILAAYAWSTLWQGANDGSGGGPRGPSRLASLKTPASALLAAIVASFLWITAPIFLADPAEAEATMVPDRGGVKVKGGSGLTELVRTVQRDAPIDRSILCLPYQPMFYFLCERRNPTRWNYLWPGDQTPAEHERLIREARIDPPALVLIAGESEMGRYAPRVLDYVHAEYRLGSESGGVRIYLPQRTDSR